MDELKKVETLWTQALSVNNIDNIAKYMSDDWQMVSENGITTKEQFLGVIKSGVLVHSRMDFDEIHVREYGDSGIVTTRGISAGTYLGEPFSFHEWSTDVYMRQNGEWKCVLTLLTTVKE